MIEDEVRAAFERHEHQVPAAEALLPGIERGYRRRRQRLLAVRAGGAGLLALLVVASSAAAVRVLGHRPHSAPATTPVASVPPSGALNFLVLGVDARPGQSLDDPSRSDSMLIVHVPASRDTADLVSIERDTRVTIPANPATGYAGGVDKINAAYYHGGVPLVVKTINQNWGITFDGAAVFTFGGLEQVINVLGGVDLYVDAKTTSVHLGHRADGSFAAPYRLSAAGVTPPVHPVPGVTPQVYPVGFQHLTGALAVDFARQRILIDGGGGSYARDRHIRQLVTAVVTKVTSADLSVDQVTAIVNAAQQGGSVFDTGGATLASLLLIATAVKKIEGIGVPGEPASLAGLAGLPVETPTATGLALLAALRAGTFDNWLASHRDLIDATR